MSVNWLTTSAAPSDVEEGTVEAPVLVLEDPKPGDLPGEPLGSGARVRGRDAEQHDDAARDRS